MRPRVLRRRLALVGFGAILAGTGIGWGAGVAKADPADLTVWASTHGFVGTNQAVILRGSLVCADLAMGYNGEQAAQDLWLHTSIADIGDARLFVIAAVDAFCPQYDRRGTERA